MQPFAENGSKKTFVFMSTTKRIAFGFIVFRKFSFKDEQFVTSPDDDVKDSRETMFLEKYYLQHLYTFQKQGELLKCCRRSAKANN